MRRRGTGAMVGAVIAVAVAGPGVAQAAPTASFTVTPSSPYTGEIVTFDGSASTCDAVPCEYRYRDLGADNSTVSPNYTLRDYASSPLHARAFVSANTKNVELSVRNARGEVGRTRRAVVVRQGPGSEPSPEPSPGPSPGPGPGPGPGGGWPTPATTGVPAGWVPVSTRSTNLTVNTAGAVVQDVRLDDGADLIINAPNVTVRRVELNGGWINADGGGTVIEDTTINPPQQGQGQEGVVSYCGYTARRVKINNRTEGFRSGGGCGAVVVEDSWARIVPPVPCGDWHGDGLQGYQGDAVIVRNTYLELDETRCGGTAAFFYPHSQGNERADIDGLIVNGGGYAFRLGTPGSVRNLNIVNNGWQYGPIDVRCSALSSWQANIVTLDGNYQPSGVVRAQPCNTESGG